MKFLNKLSENVDKLLIPIVAIAGIALVYSYLQKGGAEDIKPPQDDAWFQTQVIDAGEPVVVKFGADWCGPCRSLDKVIDEYQQQSGSVKVVKIDVDERGDLASHYKVSGIPKVIMFKQGQPVAQFVGSRPLDGFSSWIESNR